MCASVRFLCCFLANKRTCYKRIQNFPALTDATIAFRLREITLWSQPTVASCSPYRFACHTLIIETAARPATVSTGDLRRRGWRNRRRIESLTNDRLPPAAASHFSARDLSPSIVRNLLPSTCRNARVSLMLKTHAVENRRRFSSRESEVNFGTCVTRKRLRLPVPIFDSDWNAFYCQLDYSEARDRNKQTCLAFPFQLSFAATVVTKKTIRDESLAVNFASRVFFSRRHGAGKFAIGMKQTTSKIGAEFRIRKSVLPVFNPVCLRHKAVEKLQAATDALIYKTA